MRTYGTATVAVLSFILGALLFQDSNVVSAKEEAAKGWKAGLTLDEKLGSGKYICLSDGSIWETNSLDRLNATLWLTATSMAVVDNERLVPVDESVRATKLYPNDLKAKKGVRKGEWIDATTGSGRIIELSDGTLWEVDSIDRLDSSLWLMLDKITIHDEVKLENTSRKPAESVGVKRLK